jgi:hypothetical protein
MLLAPPHQEEREAQAGPPEPRLQAAHLRDARRRYQSADQGQRHREQPQYAGHHRNYALRHLDGDQDGKEGG